MLLKKIKFKKNFHIGVGLAMNSKNKDEESKHCRGNVDSYRGRTTAAAAGDKIKLYRGPRS